MKRILATVSGHDPGIRPLDGVGRPGRGELGKGCRRPRGGCVHRHDRLDICGDHGVERPAELRAVFSEHQCGPQRREDLAQRAEVTRDEGVGGRERRHAGADMQRGQRQHRGIDAVAREDDDGPVGGDPTIDQGLTHAPDPVERFGIPQRGNRAVASTPGEHRGPGRGGSPGDESVGGAGGIRNSSARPQHETAVAAPFDIGGQRVIDRAAATALRHGGGTVRHGSEGRDGSARSLPIATETCRL